jgi:hypothetical protein
MHKVLHKLIRYRGRGINLAAQVNAVVSGGEEGVSASSATSRSQIVQVNGKTWVEAEMDEAEESKNKEGNNGKAERG